MTKRISKIRSQLGITSATVLMTLAVTGNYLVPPAHAAMRTGNSNDQTSILPNEITRELTRKITVIDPHFDQPQVHHQTVRFVNENGQWRPLGSNFLPPFFPVQYENYLASQTAVKPLVVSPGQPIPDVTIRYKPLDLIHASPLAKGYLHVIAEDTANGAAITTEVGDKLGNWVDFPPAPVGYEYMCDHPDKVLIAKLGTQSVHLPVKYAGERSVKTETKKINRKVTFHLPTGKQELVQEVSAKRSIVSSANGAYQQTTAWEMDEFPLVNVPKLAGYSSSIVSVPPYQPTLDELDGGVAAVNVTYTPQQCEEPGTVESALDGHSDSKDANLEPTHEPAVSDADSRHDAGSQTNAETRDELQSLVDHSTQTSSVAKAKTDSIGVQTELANTDALHQHQASISTQTEAPVLLDAKEQTEDPEQSAVETQTEVPGQSTTATQTTSPEMVEKVGQTANHQLTSNNEHSANQPVIVRKDDDAPVIDNQSQLTPEDQPSTTNNSPAQKEEDTTIPVIKHEENQQGNTTSKLGTPTDDLVNVPDQVSNHEIMPVTRSRGKELFDDTVPNSQQKSTPPELVVLFAKDQVDRQSLDQAKLPQTSNRTDNRTTLLGMMLTVLAGFMSGRMLKAYYRRHSK